jgi:peptidoglycan/xylan/chitin deacetylase (PgdA/CDA1 family)
MYHNIAAVDESDRSPYYRTATVPQIFAAQMSHLAANGYTSISLEQLVSGAAPTKAFVLTFDDGYRDFYLNAHPILYRLGFKATVFLPTAYIGETAKQFKGHDCMTWSEVRELRALGVVFGSHTVNHPQLRNLTWPKIAGELEHSKRTIEDKLGCGTVDSFAYPFAFPEAHASFARELHRLLIRTGYKRGVCTNVGRATRKDDPLFLKRLPINSCDDLELFRAKLQGGYDWVSRPQRWRKNAAAWLGS